MEPRIRPQIARHASLWLVAAYLVGTLALLLAGAPPVPGRVLAIHTALLAIVVLLAATRRGALAFARDWLPLIAMPALYAELPYVIAAGGRPLQDAIVVSWEQHLFGGQPARQLATAYPDALLANVLHLCYLSYYLLIFVPPALLYLRGRRAEFRRTVFGIVAIFAASFVAFIAFPVEGPRYLWPPAPAPPDEPVRALALHILAAGSSRGAAFPSSHMAVSVVQTAFALRFQPVVGVISLVLTLGIGIGAVYGGFHYGTDMIAGALFGLVVAALASRVRLPVDDEETVVTEVGTTEALPIPAAVAVDTAALSTDVDPSAQADALSASRAANPS